MRFAVLLTSLAFALTFTLAADRAAAQDPPKVINVIQVDTAGNDAKFLEFTKRARTIGEKYGSTGTQRVWNSTLAGPNTGSMVVAVEFPSFVSMAQSQAKIGPSPEWQKFIADFQASGMNVLSNSVSVEVTP